MERGVACFLLKISVKYQNVKYEFFIYLESTAYRYIDSLRLLPDCPIQTANSSWNAGHVVLLNK